MVHAPGDGAGDGTNHCCIPEVMYLSSGLDDKAICR